MIALFTVPYVPVSLLGGPSGAPGRVFGTTQLRVGLTTDDDGVVRRPLCARVACWGS